MRLQLHRFRLSKAVPLAISRGTTAAVEHLLVEVEHGGLVGRGETGGFDTGHRLYDTGAIAAELEALAPVSLCFLHHDGQGHGQDQETGKYEVSRNL